MKLVFHREKRSELSGFELQDSIRRRLFVRLDPGTNCLRIGTSRARFVWNNLPIAPYQRILVARFLEPRHIRPCVHVEFPSSLFCQHGSRDG